VAAVISAIQSEILWAPFELGESHELVEKRIVETGDTSFQERMPDPSLLSDWERETRTFDEETSLDAVESMQEPAIDLRMALQELDRRRRVALWAAETPPSIPIVLPDEFAWLSEVPVETHEILQREEYDASWAPVSENQFAEFFALQPVITEEFGFPVITCRSTMCEMAFAFNDVEQELDQFGSPGAAIQARFLDATSSVSEQRWSDSLELENVGTQNVHVANRFGTTTLLWFIERKKPEDE
jgi:hypothetical protein